MNSLLCSALLGYQQAHKSSAVQDGGVLEALMMEFLPCSSEGHFLVPADSCWAQGVLASSLSVFARGDPEVWGQLSQNLERHRTAGESLLHPKAQ